MTNLLKNIQESEQLPLFKDSGWHITKSLRELIQALETSTYNAPSTLVQGFGYQMEGLSSMLDRVAVTEISDDKP